MAMEHVAFSTSALQLLVQALALYMGHSVEMQRGVYDRRTKEQKVHRLAACFI
jgi:hypothetical protein